MKQTCQPSEEKRKKIIASENSVHPKLQESTQSPLQEHKKLQLQSQTKENDSKTQPQIGQPLTSSIL
jgi:hypothetical protein